MTIRPITRKSESSSSTSARHNTVSARTSATQDTVVHELTDNAATGGFGPWGTADYAGKSINVRLVSLDSKTENYQSDYEDAATFKEVTEASGTTTGGGGSESRKGGAYNTAKVSEELLAASTLRVTYSANLSGATARSMAFTPPSISIDLCPYTADYVVPGSVRFSWMGQTYDDFEGVLYRGRTDSSPGVIAGSIDYTTGVALITDYVVGAGGFLLLSLWTMRQRWKTASIFMRTQAAPIKPGGFVMTLTDTAGGSITATGDSSGVLSGSHLRGRMDYLTGVVEMQFGDYVVDADLSAADKAEWWYSAADVGAVEVGKIWRPWPVDPTTLRYNSVAYFYLPIDADILGLDPVRLPPDGRVPIYRVGSYVVVGHTGAVGPATLSNGTVVDCARERLSRVRLLGSDGVVINTGYTADLDAGLVTIVDNTGWAQPVTVQHRIEDLVRVSDVQIDGTLTFTRQLSHDFPLGSVVSSAIMTGTLFARVSLLFDQATWSPATWSDAVVGAEATASYNASLAPIAVTNAGALTERWVFRFLTSTTFECIGENVGNIGTGSINANYAPINPIAGVPYFTVLATGWGAGWAAGNIVRMNTVGAMYPFAVIRTVQQGPAAGIDYSFELLGRGDIDRPPSAP